MNSETLVILREIREVHIARNSMIKEFDKRLDELQKKLEKAEKQNDLKLDYLWIKNNELTSKMTPSISTSVN